MPVGCVCNLPVFLRGRYMPFLPFLLPAGRKADVMAGAEAAALELKASLGMEATNGRATRWKEPGS